VASARPDGSFGQWQAAKPPNPSFPISWANRLRRTIWKQFFAGGRRIENHVSRRSRAQFNPADPEDGNIVLVLIGEVKAVGMTPSDLQKELVKRAATAGVLSQEVTVTVQSSHFRCS